MDAAWSAFSGLLSKEQLEHAQWGDVKKKKASGGRSKKVFDVAAFQGAESSPPLTPMQHTVHQLTDAKALA